MPLAEIVKAQAILKDRKPRGERNSDSYKQFTLSLYFLGPRAYSFIGKLLSLPTGRSLQKVTEKPICRPGLDKKPMLSVPEVKVETMLPQDKHYTLCIEEMALKSNLFYHTSREEIVRLSYAESDGNDIRIARNALVIMAKYLYSNWKQHIVDYFTCLQVGVKKVHFLIQNCSSKLTSWGSHEDKLVRHMGSNFIEVAESLGIFPDETEFEIAGTKMIHLFDTYHLLKPLGKTY